MKAPVGSTKPQAQLARQAFLSMLGSLNSKVVFFVLILLLLFNWFSDVLYSWLSGDEGKLWTDFFKLSVLVLFPLALFFFLHHAKRAADQLRVAVSRVKNPKDVRGLILFLSAPEGQEKGIIDDLVNFKPDELAENFRDLRDFDLVNFGKWRMPLEAIKAHYGQLDYVVLIGSARDTVYDPKTKVGKEKEGSYEFCQAFFALLAKLSPTRRIQGLCHHEIEGAGYPQGVKFNDVEQLVAATQEAYTYLVEKEGLNVREILVDITGGTKFVSAAATVVALNAGRRIQYVDTNSYALHVYDITYVE